MSDNRFLLVSNNPEQFRPDFYSWLVDNIHIYEEFEKRSLRVAQYREHYSARTILEVMRHDSAIRELDGDWKINSNYVPCLARLFSLKNLEHKDLFEFRAIKVKGNDAQS